MAAAALAEHEERLETMTGAMVPVIELFAGSGRLRADGRPKPELRAELRQIANAADVHHPSRGRPSSVVRESAA